MNRQIWVYDIETIKSVFSIVAINIDTEEIVKFVIHKDRDDREALLKHLQECKAQIGFNNVSFDYPVLHELLNSHLLETNFADYSEIIDCIYNKAQSLIESQTFGSIDFKALKEKDFKIPQLDLFRLHHFNNLARATSLKSLEISMNFPNVMEMNVHHDKEDITINEVNELLEYNTNDVLATYEFYKRSLDKIKLRADLDKQYGLGCINFPDSKIGEELVLKLYCGATGANKWDIRKLRTKRDNIALKDCIFDYINFETIKFKDLLTKFNNKTIVDTKGSIKQSVLLDNIKIDYGTGGLHACVKEGIYIPKDDEVIMSCDVASLYPSIAVVNKLYPEHLGEEFCDIYKNILDKRIEAKKAGNMTLSDGFKLSLNSVYGLSNSKFSFLEDSKYTMQTTLNGQLLISMLIERLNAQGYKILMINTDGLECIISKTSIDEYYTICKQWELDTKLTLEYVQYTKMIIGDVNNYISISNKGKIKYKGRFVIDKEYHQDNSFKIIPIALSKYFIEDISIEETINNHINIYDFCGRQKFKGQDYGETHEVSYSAEMLPYNKITRQQKNTRYYISTVGATFLKQYKKGSSEFIHKGNKVNIFNKYILHPNWKDYSIDYEWYIKEAQKEIDLIESKQLQLL